MLGILLTKTGPVDVNNPSEPKTLSEQVGVSKEEFTQCLEKVDLKALLDKTSASADLAMNNVPADQRGTPYSVIIGSNGSKAEMRGAYPKENVNELINEVLSGKVTVPYTGDIPAVTPEDHIRGSIDAPIIVVEYSDLECPFCQRFHNTMEEIVAESDGQVAWVYRHWAVHLDQERGQFALPKAAAAECIAEIKGEDAFWQYIPLIFDLMNPQQAPSPVGQL